MKKLYLVSYVQLFLAFTVMAQQISGAVKDEQGKPINDATISLLRTKDSSVVKLSLSKDGQYSFQDITAGSYLVKVSYVGYTTVLSAPVILSGESAVVPTLVLQQAKNDLKGVTVTAKRPIVEVKANKTVLNVEGTVNAVGSDALDLLRKAPGVTVDKDDNLNVRGKNGVQVFIDGRPTPLSAQELANYLKSIQSAQIESIEIITNPSAQYEAAGNAGIINIRLKKNKLFGTNGTINGGWSVGTYAKYNGGISLNHRNKKVNLFGSYNYNHGKNKGVMNLYRVVKDSLFDQHNYNLFRNKSHQYKAGMDYFINSKNTFGVMVNGAFTKPDFSNNSETPISYYPSRIVDRLLMAKNISEGKNNSVLFNVNYSYADTSGRSLTVNGDYGYYDINSNQLQPNFFYDATSNHELSRAVYNIISPTTTDIYTLKADYEQNFKKGKLAVGGKISGVTTDNNFQQYHMYANAKELDKDRSNLFRYEESINAGYINYSKSFNGIMIQAGLRVENTSLKGTSQGQKKLGDSYVDYSTTFNRNYTDLFPSAAITFNKDPKNQFGISYSRRIDRPVYQDLNPFEFKINEYTYHKGNINLRPQYTNSFGVTHTYKSKLNTALNYSHVREMFAQIVDTAEGTKAYLTNKNLTSQDIVSLNISYPFSYRAYSVSTNVNTYYAQYQANYGAGRNIDLDVLAVNLYVQNSVRFSKFWTAELSGFYTSPTIWQGSMKSKAMWSVDGGLQRQVLKGNGSFKLSVSDIFRSMKWRASSNFAGQHFKGSGTWESRQFKLSFSYRFGNSQVKAARQRSTGAEDESKRVQTGGGAGLGH